MWLKISGDGQKETKEDLIQAGERISRLLGVNVEIDAYPYGYVVNARDLAPAPIDAKISKCDCGGVGGHSSWCNSLNG